MAIMVLALGAFSSCQQQQQQASAAAPSAPEAPVVITPGKNSVSTTGKNRPAGPALSKKAIEMGCCTVCNASGKLITPNGTKIMCENCDGTGSVN